MGIITENQLDEWVRGNAVKAQGVVVQLVWRLVAASSPNPIERRFPLGDSIGQPGADGFLDTDFEYKPFVTKGKSYWEIGTGNDARAKATEDYNKLTENTPVDERKSSTFIFVTPLSGRRDWPGTWNEGGQKKWLGDQRQKGEWQDIKIIDGTRLIDWLHYFPAVERWLAYQMGITVNGIDTPEQRWENLKTIGSPPPLIPDIFLVNRDTACEKLKEVFSGTILQLKIDTHFPGQVADFVAAYVATLGKDANIDAIGRCLIVSNPDAWDTVCELPDGHVLVADFALEELDSIGTKLLEKDIKRHRVIFAGRPGGLQDSNRITLKSPKRYQIKEALEKAGYKEQRARDLAKKSDGDLSSLLRCLKNLPLMPEWSQGSDATELAIAQLLGAWHENSDADRAIVEKLSKKAYGEWIGKMREIVLRPGTPLIQRDGAWKVSTRYEAWYALGPHIFDEHLNLFKDIVVSVLTERDPNLEIDRLMSDLLRFTGHGLKHSDLLRTGLANTLALLGSHPQALTSCSRGMAEYTAAIAVREILSGVDWTVWASLNELLPLLAEASPGEFLNSVENALDQEPCPFCTIFAKEGNEFWGRNYGTGLLWALEVLAWDAEYLTRVVLILGELAIKDPGGKWRNRPEKSISTILLPWLPHTRAPVSKKRVAVETLIKEFPDVAWKVLLSLQYQSVSVSLGSCKPSWRDQMIPIDWVEHATEQEYWEQINIYAELALSAAKGNVSRLIDLIDKLVILPPFVRNQLIAYLGSDQVLAMSQLERLELWTKLKDLVSLHTKFKKPESTITQEVINQIASIAEKIAPDKIYRYRRLFSNRDFCLGEEEGEYEDVREEIDNRRQSAIKEIFETGGIESVIDFATVVESPWRVGDALGALAPNDVKEKIFPGLLESDNRSIVQFAGAFIVRSFYSRGWQWLVEIITPEWTASQKGQFLAYFPFRLDTWKQVSRFLEKDESPYWTRTNVNPYQTETGLEWAIDRLIQYGRPLEAFTCLSWLKRRRQPIDVRQAVRALQAMSDSSKDTDNLDRNIIFGIVDIIKMLQEDPETNPDDLFQIEWAYLPLLDRFNHASPILLEQKLADEPAFFCQVIQICFRSTNKEFIEEEQSEGQNYARKNVRRLLNNWSRPPGTTKGKAFDGGAFTVWLNDVKKTCSVSGHLEIALTKVGEVLYFAPHDPDGFWLHGSIATALNARDARSMRDGFISKQINMRGAFVFSAGRAERELAEEYRNKADDTDSHGYHRIAGSLRELAARYERTSESMASIDPLDGSVV